MQMAIFGRVVMLRDFCEGCQRTAFVLDGKLACCDTPAKLNQAITSLKREAVTLDIRRLNKYQKEYILDRQEHRCFYCNKMFGSLCTYRGKLIKITRHFDHIIPVAYQTDNSTPNVVAACSKCNMWKSSRIFSSIEEAKTFLLEQWRLNTNKPKLEKGRRVKVIKYGVQTSDE